MFVVFWVIVILLVAILLWLVLASIFNPLGNVFVKMFKNACDAMCTQIDSCIVEGNSDKFDTKEGEETDES